MGQTIVTIGRYLLQGLAAWGGIELSTQLFGQGTTINVAAEQKGLPKWLVPLGALVAAVLLFRYFFKSK